MHERAKEGARARGVELRRGMSGEGGGICLSRRSVRVLHVSRVASSSSLLCLAVFNSVRRVGRDKGLLSDDIFYGWIFVITRVCYITLQNNVCYIAVSCLCGVCCRCV